MIIIIYINGYVKVIELKCIVVQLGIQYVFKYIFLERELSNFVLFMIKVIYLNFVKSVCFVNIKKKCFDCLYYGC